jgi:hypothetical protein
MARQPLVLSPHYQAFARAVRDLHRLTVAGRDESSEADVIRDASESVWPMLTEIERKRLGGLSEDLYSISDHPAGNGELNPQAQALLNDAFEARQHGDWDRALELLRHWGRHLSPALVTFLRGAIWQEAGDPETAVLFLDHAARLEPSNGNYLTALLTALETADPPEAQRRAGEILAAPDSYPAVAVVRAAHIQPSASAPGPDAAAGKGPS